MMGDPVGDQRQRCSSRKECMPVELPPMSERIEGQVLEGLTGILVLTALLLLENLAGMASSASAETFVLYRSDFSIADAFERCPYPLSEVPVGFVRTMYQFLAFSNTQIAASIVANEPLGTHHKI